MLYSRVIVANRAISAPEGASTNVAAQHIALHCSVIRKRLGGRLLLFGFTDSRVREYMPVRLLELLLREWS